MLSVSRVLPRWLITARCSPWLHERSTRLGPLKTLSFRSALHSRRSPHLNAHGGIAVTHPTKPQHRALTGLARVAPPRRLHPPLPQRSCRSPGTRRGLPSACLSSLPPPTALARLPPPPSAAAPRRCLQAMPADSILYSEKVGGGGRETQPALQPSLALPRRAAGAPLPLFAVGSSPASLPCPSVSAVHGLRVRVQVASRSWEPWQQHRPVLPRHPSARWSCLARARAACAAAHLPAFPPTLSPGT